MPLESVTAYLLHERWGVLPYEGGTFGQPAELLDEMWFVKATVESGRQDEQERERDQGNRAARRARR